jgi:CheY-like chemotaxis protein
MEAILETRDYVVKTAMDAEEALQVLESFRPRPILMDIQLPGMDGLEFTRRVKRDPARRAITIIALTAYAMKGDEAKALAAGCDSYVSKPIDTRTLPKLTAGYLKQSHLAETSSEAATWDDSSSATAKETDPPAGRS